MATSSALATVGARADSVVTRVHHLVIGSINDIWSMSCREPRPLRMVAVAPPKTISGDWAIWAFFTAVIVLVTPGPAVIAATPIDLGALIQVDKPIVRARYEFAETGEPSLGGLVDGYLARAGVLGD